MIRTKIINLCLVIVVFLSSVLVACDTGMQKTTSMITDDRIVISFAASEDEKIIYEPLAETFMDENPKIRIVILSITELREKLLEQKSAPTDLEQRRWLLSHADTTYSGYITPEVIGQNLVLNLKPFMEADASFKRDDFYPGMLERYLTSEHLWALPRYRSVDVLSYNKDLFERLNIPFPKPGWSWTDMFKTAELLAHKQGESTAVYGLLDRVGGFPAMIDFLRTHNIDLAKIPAGTIRLDRPEIVGFITELRRLREKGALVVPDYFDANGQHVAVNIFELRRSGRLGMWNTSYFQVQAPSEGPLPQEQLPFKVGTVAYPSDSVFYFGEPSYAGYLVSAGTAHPQEAWKWIEFLSRQPGTIQPRFVPDSGPSLVPARKSIADQINFWKQVEPETAATYLWAIEHAPTMMDQAADYRALDSLASVFFDVYDKPAKSPQALLANAQKRLDDTLIATAQALPSPPSTEPLVVATPELPGEQQGTPITFAVRGRSYANIKQLIRLFSQQHPDIQVLMRPTNAITPETSLRNVAETTDCFIWSGPLLSDPTTDLMDVRPLLNADSGLHEADYPSALLAPYQMGDQLYGLPYTVQSYALHYDRGVFAAAGQELPNARWTPDDFLLAAQAHTRGTGNNKRYGYVPYGSASLDILFFIRQFGGQVVIGNGPEAYPNFSDPKVVQAVQWYLDLARIYHVMPPLADVMRADGRGTEEAMTLVRTGHAAMWFGESIRMLPQQLDAGNPLIDEGFAPLPLGRAGLQPDDLYTQSLHISARTAHPQECWQWLTFLANNGSPANQGIILARMSLAQSIEISEEASAEVRFFKDYLDVLRTSKPATIGPTPSYRSLNLYWFFKAIHTAATKGGQLEEHLVDAQQTTIAFIECASQIGNTKACVLLVDPTYRRD